MDESFASFIAIALAIPLFGLPLLIFGWGNELPSLDAIIVLSIAGILNFSLGRYFIWKSIGEIGANRGNILASSQVLYAVLIAILFLNQRVDISSGVGITLVMVGILLISFKGLAGTPFSKTQLRAGILAGMIGGFLWGISQVLMQIGVSEYHNATGASFITYVASLFGILPVVFFARRHSQEGSFFKANWKSFAFVVIAAMSGNLGLFFRYVALQTVPLAIVATINGTNPMITLVLSYLMIKDVEYIDKRTVFGLLSSVVGITIMSI